MLKKKIIEILIATLEKSFSDTKKARDREHEEMINAPSAMESHSDTTRSQKEGVIFSLDKRLEEYKQDISILKQLLKTEVKTTSKCQLFSLIETEYNDQIKHFFILPCAGGVRINYDKIDYNIITMEAPITKVLIGKKANDEFNLKIENSLIEGYIDKVY